MRVLVLEDDPSVMQLVLRILGRIDAVATGATNLDAALAVFSSGDGHGAFTHVISDWNISKDVTAEAFLQTVAKSVPVVLMSADKLPPAAKALAHQVVQKPFQRQELRLALAAAERAWKQS